MIHLDLVRLGIRHAWQPRRPVDRHVAHVGLGLAFETKHAVGDRDIEILRPQAGHFQRHLIAICFLPHLEFRPDLSLRWRHDAV